jgi:DNA-binding Lrp family transcriptional regulator
MTADEIVHAYTVQELSTNEIGRRMGVSPSWVTERLENAGVARRPAGSLTAAQRADHASKAVYRPPVESRDAEFVALILAAGGYQNAYIRGMTR